MAFIETQFPTDVSSGSRGGPGFMTGIVVVDSGYERRRVRWPLPRHKYDVAYGVRTAPQLEAVVDFFYAMQGKAHGFRYKDPLDFKSCAYEDTVSDTDIVLIASAVGGEDTFQLFKPYIQASQTVNRLIKKPVTGTVVVSKNATPLVETTDFTVDYTTGVLTLTGALVATDSLSCGFEFDVPCRFDTDVLSIQLEGALVGHTEVTVVEIRV